MRISDWSSDVCSSDLATPETARTALEVRALAQRIVDEAMAQQAWPRYADIELARNADWIEEGSDLRQALDTQFARCTVSGPLDFIDTDHGPMLLEAGPPVSPFGGGHPCAFAGPGRQRSDEHTSELQSLMT